MSLELCYISAVEAIARFRSGVLSPVELMQAIVARAADVEPHINAFTYTYFDEAIDAAREAEKRYQAGIARPLEGIPLAVKDESMIAGLPTSNGSLTMESYVADSTSLVVERLLDAGAIVHARTATPEFSTAVFTWSRLWGVTRNPWNGAITPGGSTGGGAAALAAGTTTLINGTDIAGSIRVPAAMCGVVGYKPPYGRNPEDPPWNLESYTHHGPLARDIDDCILLQNIMSGPHSLDIVSLKPKLTLPQSFPDIAGWKIGYSLDFGFQPVVDEVKQVVEASLSMFEAAGATLVPVDLNWPADSAKAALDRLAWTMMGQGIRQADDAHHEKLTSYAQWMAEYCRRVTAEEFVRAEQMAADMFWSLSKVFDEVDLFVCPTTAQPGVAADFDYGRETLSINGEAVNPKIGWVMTYPFNMLSQCPVLAVPAGFASNNVPIGIQLVAPPYEDAVVFQAAKAYEQAWQRSAKPSPFISLENLPRVPNG